MVDRGQGHARQEAAARAILQPDVAAMAMDDGTGDRETEPCAAGLGALAGARAALPDPPPGIQHIRGEHGGWFGGHRQGAGAHFGRLCDGERRTEWLDDRLPLVDSFADFNPEQAEAWTRFTDALRAGSVRIGEACAADEAAGPADSAPERLARVERMMAAGLEILRELRPAFEAFYATLNEEQQAALEKLTADWRRHH